MARRGGLGWPLFVLLLVMPILEIFVIILVGQRIGGWRTFGLLVITSLVGAWLVRREWRTAWRSLRSALQSGKMPARELTDAALVLIGGTMLLAPGFVSDVIGLIMILPFTRPLMRPLLQAAVARRLLAGPSFVTSTAQQTHPRSVHGAQGPHGPQPGSTPPPRRSAASDDVIEGEIVDD
ncbi:FxsA family protein [Yimella sp. cx-51]|nr:FxsA family protein [Yimella sp. cx-51]QTH39571.1 FxsA family protein [Yimella sp. cx-51]